MWLICPQRIRIRHASALTLMKTLLTDLVNTNCVKAIVRYRCSTLFSNNNNITRLAIQRMLHRAFIALLIKELISWPAEEELWGAEPGAAGYHLVYINISIAPDRVTTHAIPCSVAAATSSTTAGQVRPSIRPSSPASRWAAPWSYLFILRQLGRLCRLCRVRTSFYRTTSKCI